MSILKADAVTAAQSNTDLSLSGSGTGGVKVTDYLVQTKGSDIASATALALGKDGNFFDVTGTTTITSIGTQGIGSCVTLQFDGALTFTHHSTDLILPGAANITTAAGDIAVMYEYASGDWRCVSYTKASGAAVVATVNNDQWSGTDLSVANGGTGASTHTANNVLVGAGTSAIASIAPSTSGNVLTSNGSAWTSAAAAGGGKILQSFGAKIAAVSGTTGIPGDNTSPLVSEGTEIFSQAITCASTSNKILLSCDLNTYITVGSGVLITMFRDSTCINASMMGTPSGANFMSQSAMCLDAPSSTSAITYSVRVGEKTDTGTWYIGQYNAAVYNGALAGNSVLIQEIDYT
jgi:hypothetical protein